MLRITLPTQSNPGLFILEGKLTGLWARELVRVVRQTGMPENGLVDLEEVFPIDSVGEEALRLLGAWGARFIADSAFHKDFCKRLKLHRVDTANFAGGKRPDGPRNPGQRPAPYAVRLGAFNVANANQRPQRRAK